ncbi:MAG: hypothetical protein ACRC14_01260 [Paracoccaceae bacterium]
MNNLNHAADWVGHPLAMRDLVTPAYYVNLNAITEDITAVRAALGGEVLQDVSACPLQEMLSRLPSAQRFGAVTASRGELNMVAGWDTDHAYVRQPGLSSQLARAVIGAGHRLIAESPSQIAMLAQVRGARKVAPVLLSVHPSVVIAGMGGDCGMIRPVLDQAVAVAVAEGIAIDGLALAHAGAFDPDQALAALRGMRALAAGISAQTGQPVMRLVMGEWLDVLTTPHPTDRYRAEVAAGPQGEVPAHLGGASIFRRAGVMVSRVVDVQPGPSGPRAVCDAILRPAFGDSLAASAPDRALRLINRVPAPADATSTLIVGTSGAPGDRLGHVAHGLQIGDIVALDSMGAQFRGFDPVVAPEGKRLPAFLFFDAENGYA